MLGTIAGLVWGLAILYFRQSLVDFAQRMSGENLWDPSVRFITDLPSRTDPFEILLIVAIAIGSSFFITLFPGVEGGEHRSGAGAAL